MKNLRLSILALFVIGVFVVSCSKEDETPVATDESTITDNTNTDNTDNTDDTSPMDTTIIVGDTTFMIIENSAVSASVGTLAATTNHGSVTFSIKSQSIDGALAIDENSGEMTVADELAFDYETNSSLTAVVSVMNGSKTMEANITVDLEDQDIFLASLTDSKPAYESAKDGDWIEVTQEEYESLQSIQMVNESGVGSVDFPNSLSSAGDWSGSMLTNSLSGDSVKVLPSNSYFYAFKYFVAFKDEQKGVKVKLSLTNEESGFSPIGNVLPSHSGVGIHYFIYKTDKPTSISSKGYLGVLCSQIGFKSPVSGYKAHWTLGDGADLDTSADSYLLYYQGLSTTKVQW